MKKYFDKLSRTIGLTPQEGTIVFILLGTFLLGLVLKAAGVNAGKEERFDYSASDTEFFQKSATIQSVLASEDSANAQAENNRLSGMPSANELVDINSATKEALMSLPGIGEAMAERIIMYREEHGKFTSPEQLKNIRGVGDKKYEQLKPYVTLQKKQ